MLRVVSDGTAGELTCLSVGRLPCACQFEPDMNSETDGHGTPPNVTWRRIPPLLDGFDSRFNEYANAIAPENTDVADMPAPLDNNIENDRILNAGQHGESRVPWFNAMDELWRDKIARDDWNVGSSDRNVA